MTDPLAVAHEITMGIDLMVADVHTRVGVAQTLVLRDIAESLRSLSDCVNPHARQQIEGGEDIEVSDLRVDVGLLAEALARAFKDKRVGE
jgi:hypothetical protein